MNALRRFGEGKRVILVSATPLNNRPRHPQSGQALPERQGQHDSKPPRPRSLLRAREAAPRASTGSATARNTSPSCARTHAKFGEVAEVSLMIPAHPHGNRPLLYRRPCCAGPPASPDVAAPEPLFYQLDTHENRVFTPLSSALRTTSLRALPPRSPTTRAEAQRYDSGCAGQPRALHENPLVKRLESSFHAFRLTLARFIRT